MGLQHHEETEVQAVIGERPVCNSSHWILNHLGGEEGFQRMLETLLQDRNDLCRYVAIISGSHGDCLRFLVRAVPTFVFQSGSIWMITVWVEKPQGKY